MEMRDDFGISAASTGKKKHTPQLQRIGADYAVRPKKGVENVPVSRGSAGVTKNTSKWARPTLKIRLPRDTGYVQSFRLSNVFSAVPCLRDPDDWLALANVTNGTQTATSSLHRAIGLGIDVLPQLPLKTSTVLPFSKYVTTELPAPKTAVAKTSRNTPEEKAPRDIASISRDAERSQKTELTVTSGLSRSRWATTVEVSPVEQSSNLRQPPRVHLPPENQVGMSITPPSSTPLTQKPFNNKIFIPELKDLTLGHSKWAKMTDIEIKNEGKLKGSTNSNPVSSIQTFTKQTEPVTVATCLPPTPAATPTLLDLDIPMDFGVPVLLPSPTSLRKVKKSTLNTHVDSNEVNLLLSKLTKDDK
jgi:hypothetical protein